MATPKLTEKTLFPLSIVSSLLAGAFWVATVAAQTKQNEKDNAELKARVDRNAEVFSEIKAKLERIDGQVQFIYNSVRGGK